MGSSVLAQCGYLCFPEVTRFTYWQMPLYLVGLGAWLRVLPFNIETVRLFSVFWGIVFLAAWFVFVKNLAQNRDLALIITCFIALDYSFISAASNGRMDMMCAALGQCALAAYAKWRQTNIRVAILAAACFGALALFAHPLGLLMNGLVAVLLLLDWKRLDWRALLWMPLPYVVAVGLYILYALQAPAIYTAQSLANSGYRVSSRAAVLHHLLFDFKNRYLVPYFLGATGLNKLKVFSLLFGLVGLAALALNRRLRGLLFSKVLVLFCLVSYVALAIADNQTIPVYLIYSTPWLTACAATWLFYQTRGTWKRSVGFTLASLSIAATIGAFGFKLYRNDRLRVYQPVVSAVEASLPEHGFVMGGSELGFALGFDPSRLSDDRYLGYFSNREPDVFVENPYYGKFAPAHLDDVWDWSRRELSENYHLVFSNEAYRVYRRNPAATMPAKPDLRPSRFNAVPGGMQEPDRLAKP